MRCARYLLALLAALAGVSLALAQDLKPEDIDFKTFTPPACSLPEGDLGLKAPEAEQWTHCEKLVWSCVRQGLEANLYVKMCTNPRPGSGEPNWRMPFDLAAFAGVERYKDLNGLRDGFLRTILSDTFYSDQLKSPGIRIFGGYFAEHVNFENIKTRANMVIDGSILKKGIRFTNFETSKNISLDGSNVRGAVLLFRARIDGSLFLQGGVYDSVDTRDARIGSSLDGIGSVFNDELRIDRARIDGKINLSKARLTVFNAWSAHVGGYLEMRLADIRLQMDLTGATIAGDVRLPRISFGRRVPGGSPRCDWEPDTGVQSALQDTVTAFKDDPAGQQMVLEEIVGGRGGKGGRQEDDICVGTAEAKKRYRSNEVLLRDMKIGGTLCLIDVTGEIPVKDEQRRLGIETISFDGTQANSTVLRWKDSKSTTLWRAVNFKTNYMLVNLEFQPRRHFVDNLDVGFFAMVKRDPDGREPVAGDADFDKFLCDVTPESKTRDPLDSREAQDRIISLFRTNESGSSQPFANVVSRLESSGVASTYLKRELSAYQARNSCSNSLFVKEWPRFRDAWRSRNDITWAWPWEKAEWALKDAAQAAAVAPSDSTQAMRAEISVFDETRKLGLDGLCALWRPVYAYTTSYGHEPHNLFYFVVVAIILFWALLKTDKRPESDAVPVPRLGLVYAIDTFIPLAQFRMNRRYANVQPIRPWLRTYLKLHRAIGLVLSLAVFMLVFKAV